MNQNKPTKADDRRRKDAKKVSMKKMVYIHFLHSLASISELVINLHIPESEFTNVRVNSLYYL